jgi:DNA transformation protein
MGVSASQVAFAEELFADLGVSTRRMFGGAGLYAQGVMFALIDESEAIFLKADEALRAELAAEGCYPWVYTYPSGPKAGEAMETGYMSLPDAALDEPAAACVWGRRGLDVALRAAAAKRAKTRR